MASVPYLYINLTALALYALIFLTFLLVKKTPEIRSFIFVICGFFTWSAGSILMRLQVFPGVEFWYYVSILSLFSIALLLYLFVCSFVRARGFMLKAVWIVGTLLMLALTATGVFLAPPVVEYLPTGETVFTYHVTWTLVFPCLFILAILFSILMVFRRVIKEKGIRAPGIPEIVAGCIIVGIGNVVQVLPGNIFPWDTLTGIIFAFMLIFALYKRRMFRLTLIISRSVLLIICAVVCLGVAAYLVDPVQTLLTSKFGLSSSIATTCIIVLFTITLSLLYTLTKRLLDVLITSEEQQGRLLRQFSLAISKTLKTSEIMPMLVDVIRQEISVDRVYICLPENGEFVSRYASRSLEKVNFSIAAGSSFLSYLQEEDTCMLIRELKRSPIYLSMWEEEKALLQHLDISCIVALRDGGDIVGLVLLSKKEKGNDFNYGDLSFLDTISSIASIALRNASLYERIFREARIDSLTGTYNYSYFVEKLPEMYHRHGRDCLALIFFDVDDLKLYNQLYGAVEGDFILRRTAEILRANVGEQGEVFRCSGKVFAAIVPGKDGREAHALAADIQRRVASINQAPERSHLKPVTLSCGICVSPYSAASAKELIENADLAVYNAKSSGKSQIIVFMGSDEPTDTISKRTIQIIDGLGSKNKSSYEAYSSTIFALTAAIDAKDHYTYNHSRNVARYAAILATATGMNEEQIRVVYEAGLLHDIGKISIPEHILRKESKLTDDEYSTMKEHVNNSIDIIRHLPSMDYVIPAAVGHHERWDGRGYPTGLRGEDIPLAARCLAVADSFDAMTTDRPYRKGLPLGYAIDQINGGAGTQFDPRLASLFVDLLQNGEIVPDRIAAD